MFTASYMNKLMFCTRLGDRDQSYRNETSLRIQRLPNPRTGLRKHGNEDRNPSTAQLRDHDANSGAPNGAESPKWSSGP